MSKLIQIGVTNGSGPDYVYLIGVCGQPLQPYTGNPTTETSIIVDLVDYGWSEGQQYCYQVADLGTGCICSESGPIPTLTPTQTETPTNTPSNTQTPTNTQTQTNTPSDEALIFTLTACTISDAEQPVGTVEYFCNSYSPGQTLTLPTVVNEPCDLAPFVDRPDTDTMTEDYIECMYQYYFGTGDTTNISLLDVNGDGSLDTYDLISFLNTYAEVPLSEYYGCTFYPTVTACTQNGFFVGSVYYNETFNACYEVTGSTPSGGSTETSCGVIDVSNDYELCTTCEDENVYFWQLNYVPWDYSYSPNLGSGEFLVENQVDSTEFMELDVTLVTDGSEPPGFISFEINSIVSQSPDPPFDFNFAKLNITMFE